MNIDDIVDERRNRPSPGERFHRDWLEKIPVGQWPSYIDESAQLVADGIFIGETDLTTADFASETGEYYRRGLAETGGVEPNETSLPLGNYSAEEVGLVAWVFNRLREEIRRSEYTEFENPSRAIEAAVNKALVESIEDGQLDTRELETIRLPENATVSTLLSEVFCRPRSNAYVDLLVDIVRESATSSLLERIEEPRMVTPLWDHQREALDAWLAHDCRGYVNMATATGKTVLGLAAVAHHFGALHPSDRDLTAERLTQEIDGRATVIVVAHRDLVLDQWKREFDTHLNIPEQSTTRSGEHTAEFEWGDVHFWTPNRLRESGVPDADLVVLDETHHYLGSSGFGAILDEIDGYLLALSGSLDDANARTLERRGIPELFEFTLRQGQKAGVIPQCDWDVIFTPYADQSQLAEITAECRVGFDRYADGVELANGSSADSADTSFRTLSEARSLAQSSVGRKLKERDPEFREFASAVMARQLTQYNISPSLSTIVHLVLDHVDQHKCVVLLETLEEIEWVSGKLEARLGDAFESLVTVFDEESELSVIEEFDRERDNGAIVGVAHTLGEGVDIETADVCINRGRGRLSRSLVQRMGRILRNPDGDKHARFFHVSGVPTREEATLVNEDGTTLLETASQLLAWGEKFQARPVFAVDTETTMTKRDLADLETAGASAIDEWTPDHYEWPSDEDIREHLESLCARLGEHDTSALLSIERTVHDAPDATDPESTDVDERPAGDAVRFVTADGEPVELVWWLYELASATHYDDPDAFVEECVRSYARERLMFPPADAVPNTERFREVSMNPALEAVLSAYSEAGARDAAVHTAVAETLAEEVDDPVERAEIGDSEETVRKRFHALLEGSANA